MAVVEEVERNGLRVRELTIEDARIVTAALWQNPSSGAGMPLVCLGHGASGDRYQQPIPWLVERLVGQHGFAALSLDGPVHGRRQIGDGGREAFWPEWRRPGTVADMLADWRAALDFVQALPDVGGGPVGYWGLSMGTIYGAPLVAAEQRIVVAVLGLMGITGPDHYRPTITDAAHRIEVPVLFLMQLDDELFSRDECLTLFDELATEDKRLHANAGLHPAVPLEELYHSVDFLVNGLTGGHNQRGAAFSVAT
ncbi:MAG: hypothetical protein OEV40_08045 [Acidimicrobiia bacterium]|nr:hypothetical protein [Acidimicrobiia bacterium]